MTGSINIQAQPVPLIWAGTGTTSPGSGNLLEDESGNIITDENGNPIEITV
jgi:hypothetical protein